MAKEMTPAKFRSFVIRKLKRAWLTWPPRYEAIKKARVAPGTYECSDCKTKTELSNINIDHINPTIDPILGFIDWNSYIVRLFCDVTGYQALCKACHKMKTDEENIKRKEMRDLKKKGEKTNGNVGKTSKKQKT